jgi:hydrogenase/urease accessory protein HupE
MITSSYAHEMEPGFVDITQLSEQKFKINWSAPIYYQNKHPAQLVFPKHWQILVTQPVKKVHDSHLYSQLVNIPNGEVSGSKIHIKGLEKTITEVFVRTLWLSGKKTSLLILPQDPWFEIVINKTNWQISGDYIYLGVVHIIKGFDHLGFVLMLMWMVTIKRKLLLTITAFTLAHSITLTTASLGIASLAGPPVETMIALSIVFMAIERLKVSQGKNSLTAQYPWLVAFFIGLIHGFGFSGALKEVGLPDSEILLALISFNFGVELGQLLFIIMIFVLTNLLNKIVKTRPEWVNNIPVYLVGGIASFWFFERISQF